MKNYKEMLCKVTSQHSLAPDCFLLTLEAPQLAKAAAPGQFVMISCAAGYDPFLRRPLSIHQVDRNSGEISLLYRVKGKGTAQLSQHTAGKKLSLLGPLGHGFSFKGRGKKALLIGAGIGAAPLLFLAEELALQEWQPVILLGARAKAGIYREEAFAKCGQVRIVTDDGSAGEQGLILEFLEKELERNSFEMFFACGPLPVLKGVQDLSRKSGIAAQISLEERMACGVGACLGCACRSAGGDYLRVCREGPVFAASEVIIDG